MQIPMERLKYWGLHVAAPLILGLLCYNVTRPYSKFYVPSLGFHDSTGFFTNLPDVLWAYSLTAALHFIWPSRKSLVFMIFLFNCIAFELCQIQIIAGTFDVLDLGLYLIGFLVCSFIITETKTQGVHSHEKQ